MAGDSHSFSFPFSEKEMPVRLGRYMLLRQRSADPVGEQFLAAWGVEEGLDQLRVFRAIYPELAAESQFVALFTEEARALSRLAGANVVRVMEVGTVSGIPFVATEYVEGVSLARLVAIGEERGERCPFDLAAHIACEILRGLEHVHRREDILGKPIGMRHGDVRPANVLVSFEGEVKLTDFGSSLYLIADQETSARVEEMRRGFTAPEQRVRREATVAGDLWGVAAVLSTLLAGNPSGTDPQFGLSLVETAPDALRDFMARALHPEESQRFPDAAAMRAALAGILERFEQNRGRDGVVAWVNDWGAGDRQGDEAFVREMIARDMIWSVQKASEAGELKPGTVLDGRYRLIAPLGEGGMGQVFEAEHLGIGRRVAIKVLHRRIVDDAVVVERFRREARIAGSLGHPNIVDVSDFGVTSEGHHYLAMELLHGDSLGRRMKGGLVSYLELAGIMARVCDGLEAAHRAGVIHRDLKPENIFLTETGPKIVDFGIARRTGLEARDKALTRDGFICGTAEYLAPEQVRGKEHDHRADIYAAGVILYEGLTGRTPFSGETVGDTLQKVMTGRLVPPRKLTGDATIPRELERICLRALSRDPAKRFASAADMAAALRAMLFSDEGDEASEHSEEKTRARKLGFRLLVALVVALAAILFIALAAFSIRMCAASRERPVPVSIPPAAPPQKSSSGPAPGPAVSGRPAETPVPEPPPLVFDAKGTAARPTAQAARSRRASALVAEGEQALKRAEMETALARFQEATQSDPSSAEAWYGLGRAAAEQERYADAIRHVERALRLSPAKPRWRVYLGQLFMASGQRDRAVAEWQKVLAADPHNADAAKLLRTAGVPFLTNPPARD